MKSFEYMRPSSLEEACAMLAAPDGPVDQAPRGRHRPARADEAGGPAAARAGQPSRRARPRASCALGDDRGLVIGAATPLGCDRELAGCAEGLPGIAEAASYVGSLQVRIGRRSAAICATPRRPPTRPPSSSPAVPRRSSPTGGRIGRVPLEDFFVGPGQTVIRPGELLKAIDGPAPSPDAGFAKYFKSFRSAMDCCTVGVAVVPAFGPDTLVIGRPGRPGRGSPDPDPRA